MGGLGLGFERIKFGVGGCLFQNSYLFWSDVFMLYFGFVSNFFQIFLRVYRFLGFLQVYVVFFCGGWVFRQFELLGEIGWDFVFRVWWVQGLGMGCVLDMVGDGFIWGQSFGRIYVVLLWQLYFFLVGGVCYQLGYLVGGFWFLWWLKWLSFELIKFLWRYWFCS